MALQMIMTSIPKPTPPATSFFLVILSIHIIAFLELSSCITENYNSATILCPEIEKEALVSFKKSLEKSVNQLLISWNNSEVNCCKWEGVVCSNSTGHVHELRLQNYGLQSSGKSINHSLLNLKQLRYLDLSQNDFDGTIPSFIGSLKSLEYLNLSKAGLYGTIPHTIGNLSKLRTLSLKSNYPNLEVDNLEWVSGLSQLEHLNMNNVNLSKAAANWVQVINTLPSLLELHFQSCSLNFIVDPLSDVNNISSLAVLDLSNNDFQSFFFPRWILKLRNLIFLDLSFNRFEGPIPSINNTTKLQHIDLTLNSFNSTIPNWLYFCKGLTFLSLSANSLEGTISSSIENLSSLNTLDLSANKLSGEIPRNIFKLCNMRKLDLSRNKLQGEISNAFGNMSECFLDSLESLSLSYNQLSGVIPTNLGKLLSVQVLDLSNNKLTGNLPKTLGQLLNLESLDIGYNMLKGIVTESHFANHTNLRVLSASENHLSLKVKPNWIPRFKLESLQLSSWNLGADTKTLSWLDTQKNTLVGLDLSNTGISGHVPTWFWKISELNVSHNLLRGNIPDKIGIELVYLNSNQFSGPLPQVRNTVLELDLTNNSFSGGISHFFCDSMTNGSIYRMQILHLGGNQLAGKLPDCWMKWPSLRFLDLGNNNLSGSIPNSIGFLAKLRSLNLYRNKFSGPIPVQMQNCTELVKIDLADNVIVGNIPTWMGASLPDLRIFILRSNKLSGKISSNICHLNFLQILDLSNNNFFGIIPRCVDNFTAMATKRNLADYDARKGMVYVSGFLESANVFTKGTQLNYDTILPLVTNIDLSRNNLSGNIPKELTSLVELRSLNLSSNHLTGAIPDSIGDMKQLESLDFSRNSLFGGIPNSFTTMSSLSHLNLSYNNLTGRIPESTQILGLDASSFIGNHLCGRPLTSKCGNDNEVPGSVNKEDDEGDKSKVEWFYVFLSSGWAVGFSIVCTTLIFNKSLRDAYFEFLEEMWDSLYVFFYIKWRRLANR